MASVREFSLKEKSVEMLDIEDEYIRNFSFDPEFIQRKKSLDNSLNDRLGSEQTHKRSRSLMRKFRFVDRHKSISDENLKISMVDAEVDLFYSVNFNHMS